ncbi:very long chain fatty acid elongase 4-like [Dysidea avara]|uniref:very long chain fatty acid elongase 4-like n=1 Tax=Dysidea avara TaxID=196820 RepID=UPI003331C767
MTLTIWLIPIHCYSSLKEFYYDKLLVADNRVDGWLLTDSYVHTVLLSMMYVIMTIVGPYVMKDRPPVNIRVTMLVYNFVMIILSYYMFHEFFFGMIDAGFNYICDPVNYSDSPSALRLVSACWWFYFSKLVEFMDTLFFILRKKNNQISFLHVYHHASMPIVWWIGVKWAAGGCSCVQASINCFVHVIMYSYYFLSGLGPSVQKYLWWKKYVTILQLVQFCLIISHTSYAFFSGCQFPRGIMYLNFFYVNSILFLFINFYIRLT